MEKIGVKDGGAKVDVVVEPIVVNVEMEEAKAGLMEVESDTRSGDAVREEVMLRKSLEALDLEMGSVGAPTNIGTQRASAGQDHYLGGKFRGLMARLGIGKKSEQQGRRRSKSIDPKKDDKGAKASADDKLDIYQVDPKRVVVMILNNKNFPKDYNPRIGSEKDVENLEKTFKKVGYEVFTRQDLTAREMREEIKNMGKILEARPLTTLFIAVVMTHGVDHGWLAGIDVEFINTREFITGFDAMRVPTMKTKPKLIFFAACRGNFNEQIVRENSLDDEFPPSETSRQGAGKSANKTTDPPPRKDHRHLPVARDMFLVYSSSPGSRSYRNTYKGAWSVQAFLKVFNKYARKENIYELITRIAHSVSVDFGYREPPTEDRLDQTQQERSEASESKRGSPLKQSIWAEFSTIKMLYLLGQPKSRFNRQRGGSDQLPNDTEEEEEETEDQSDLSDDPSTELEEISRLSAGADNEWNEQIEDHVETREKDMDDYSDGDSSVIQIEDFEYANASEYREVTEDIYKILQNRLNWPKNEEVLRMGSFFPNRTIIKDSIFGLKQITEQALKTDNEIGNIHKNYETYEARMVTPADVDKDLLSIFAEEYVIQLELFVSMRAPETTAKHIMDSISYHRHRLINNSHSLEVTEILQKIYTGSRYALIEPTEKFKFRLNEIDRTTRQFLERYNYLLMKNLIQEMEDSLTMRVFSLDSDFIKGTCSLHVGIEALLAMDLPSKALHGDKKAVATFKELRAADYNNRHELNLNVKKMLLIYGKRRYDTERGESGYNVLMILLVRLMGIWKKNRLLKVFPLVHSIPEALVDMKDPKTHAPYSHIIFSSVVAINEIPLEFSTKKAHYQLIAIGECIPEHIFLLKTSLPIVIEGNMLEMLKVDPLNDIEPVKVDLRAERLIDFVIYARVSKSAKN